MKGRVYVVTAVHNRYKITEKFLSYLGNQTYSDIHLILVDDGSTDGTTQMAKKIFPDTTIIKGNGNLWWGGALNKAYKWIFQNASEEDYVLISNDDVELTSEYIETGLSYLDKRDMILLSGIGISKYSGKIIDSPINWDLKKGMGKQLYNDFTDANCVSTRSLFMTVKTMKFVKGFHPVLLPHYASDYEWTIRAVRKGCKIESFSNLKYKFDDKATGVRDRKKATLKQIFSKKSNFNPIYRFNFIALSTPKRYLMHALFEQLKRI